MNTTSTNEKPSSNAISGSFQICRNLPPLKCRKNPTVAGMLGFFLGALGLGLYCQTAIDFVLPVILWIVCCMIGVPTGGVGILLGPVFCAFWGIARVNASNAKLDALKNDSVIEVTAEPSRKN